MGKKGKGGKGKSGKGGKMKGPNDGPSLNEIILRRGLKLYEAYSAAMDAKCSPDVVKAIKLCLEEETQLTKLIVLPINKDLKAEERFRKAMREAEEEGNHSKITELRANYNNTPPQVFLGPLMRAFNEVQLQSIHEMYVIDLPLFYADMMELVTNEEIYLFYF